MFVILEIKRFQQIDMILSNGIMNIDVDPQILKGLSNGIINIDDNPILSNDYQSLKGYTIVVSLVIYIEGDS